LWPEEVPFEKHLDDNFALFSSIKESLCSKTPMLAMPMFAEQNHNAFMVLEFGTGIALNKVLNSIHIFQ